MQVADLDHRGRRFGFSLRVLAARRPGLDFDPPARPLFSYPGFARMIMILGIPKERRRGAILAIGICNQDGEE